MMSKESKRKVLDKFFAYLKETNQNFVTISEKLGIHRATLFRWREKNVLPQPLKIMAIKTFLKVYGSK